MPRPADLNIREFRDALIDHGFAYLGASVDRYVDLRIRRPGHYIQPVKDARKRILRRETLAALLAARAILETAKKTADATRARQEKIAAAIAPTAISPARAGLAAAAAIAQLSDDFIVLTTRNDSADLPDLLLLGWQREQIEQYLEPARTLAYRRQDLVLA